MTTYAHDEKLRPFELTSSMVVEERRRILSEKEKRLEVEHRIRHDLELRRTEDRIIISSNKGIPGSEEEVQTRLRSKIEIESELGLTEGKTEHSGHYQS